MPRELLRERCNEFVTAQDSLLKQDQSTPLAIYQWQHDYVYSYMRLLDFPLAEKWQASFADGMKPAVRQFYPTSLKSTAPVVSDLKNAVEVGLKLALHSVMQPEIFSRFRIFAYRHYLEKGMFTAPSRDWIDTPEFTNLMTPVPTIVMDEFMTFELANETDGFVEFSKLLMEVYGVVNATFEYLREDSLDTDAVLNVICKDVIGGSTKRTYDGQSFDTFQLYCETNYKEASEALRGTGMSYRKHMGMDSDREQKRPARTFGGGAPPSGLKQNAVKLTESKDEEEDEEDEEEEEGDVKEEEEEEEPAAIGMDLVAYQPHAHTSTSSSKPTQRRAPTGVRTLAAGIGAAGNALGLDPVVHGIATQAAQAATYVNQPAPLKIIGAAHQASQIRSVQGGLNAATGIATAVASAFPNPYTLLGAATVAASALSYGFMQRHAVVIHAWHLFQYLKQFLPYGAANLVQTSNVQNLMMVLNQALDRAKTLTTPEMAAHAVSVAQASLADVRSGLPTVLSSPVAALQRGVAVVQSAVANMGYAPVAPLTMNFDAMYMIHSIQASHWFTLSWGTNFLLLGGFTFALGRLIRFQQSHSMTRAAQDQVNAASMRGMSASSTTLTTVEANSLSNAIRDAENQSWLEEQKSNSVPDNQLTQFARDRRDVRLKQPARYSKVLYATMSHLARSVMKNAALRCLKAGAIYALFTLAERFVFYSGSVDAHTPGIVPNSMFACQTHAGTYDLRAAGINATNDIDICDPSPWKVVPFFIRTAVDICATNNPYMTALGSAGSALQGLLAANVLGDVFGIAAETNGLTHALSSGGAYALVAWSVMTWLAQQPQVSTMIERVSTTVAYEVGKVPFAMRNSVRNFIDGTVSPFIGSRFVPAEFIIRLWEYVQGMVSPQVYNAATGVAHAVVSDQLGGIAADAVTPALTFGIASYLPSKLVDWWGTNTAMAWWQGVTLQPRESDITTHLVKGSQKMHVSSSVRAPGMPYMPQPMPEAVEMEGSFWGAMNPINDSVQMTFMMLGWVRIVWVAVHKRVEKKETESTYTRTKDIVKATVKFVSDSVTLFRWAASWGNAWRNGLPMPAWDRRHVTDLFKDEEERPALTAPQQPQQPQLQAPTELPQLLDDLANDIEATIEKLAHLSEFANPYPQFERVRALHEYFTSFIATFVQARRPHALLLLQQHGEKLFELTYRLFVTYRRRIFSEQKEDVMPKSEGKIDFAGHIERAFSFAGRDVQMREHLDGNLPVVDLGRKEHFFLNYVFACGVYITHSITDDDPTVRPTLQYVLACINDSPPIPTTNVLTATIMTLEPRTRHGTQHADTAILATAITDTFLKCLADVFQDEGATVGRRYGHVDMLRLAFRMFVDYREYVLDAATEDKIRFKLNAAEAFKLMSEKIREVVVRPDRNLDRGAIMKVQDTHWQRVEIRLAAGRLDWLAQDERVTVKGADGTEEDIVNPVKGRKIVAGRIFPLLHMFMLALSVRVLVGLSEELQRSDSLPRRLQDDFVLPAVKWEREHGVAV